MRSDGIRLIEPYLGANGALTGSARRFEEARVRREELARTVEVERLQEKIAQRRRRTEAQIEALNAELEADEIELTRVVEQESVYLTQLRSDAAEMAASRKTQSGGAKA